MSDSIRLSVRLIPIAAQNKIHGWTEDSEGEKTLKISVTTAPEKGKANKALINLLAKEWKIPKSDIQIVKGEKTRNKALILNNISKSPLDRIE